MRYFCLALCLMQACLSAEPTCKRCEIIREHNKENPGTDEYYEDYLKEQEVKKGATAPSGK